MYNWLTRTCVASTWPPKAPLGVWKRLPSVPWEEPVGEAAWQGEDLAVVEQEAGGLP